MIDFGCPMEVLGIQIIYANSAQVRGRVERGNRTHHYCLIKVLRHRGISTIAEANRLLGRSYLSDRNICFVRPADGLLDIHLSLNTALNLVEILCFQTQRYLRHDFTITLDTTKIQILRDPYALPVPPSMSLSGAA
jgi:hypothetical protein